MNDAIHFEILKRKVDWDSTDGIKIFDAKRLTLVVNVIISARHFWFRDEHSNPVDRKLMTLTHIANDYERMARSLSRTKYIMKDVMRAIQLLKQIHTLKPSLLDPTVSVESDGGTTEVHQDSAYKSLRQWVVQI